MRVAVFLTFCVAVHANGSYGSYEDGSYGSDSATKDILDGQDDPDGDGGSGSATKDILDGQDDPDGDGSYGSYNDARADSPLPTTKNPPKPKFVAADFDLAAMSVVDGSIEAVTLPPTAAPTSSPTKAGMVWQTKEVPIKVVKVTPIEFPFSKAEAELPAVRKSLIDGFAAAIGMASDYVTIGAITEKTNRWRRLSAMEVDVEFVVESMDFNGADALANTIEAAAKEGSIIANIQKEASSNGVLTKKLSEMTRELPSVGTTVEATTKEMDVQVPAPAPAPPTPAPPSESTPTKSPTQSPTQSPTAPAPASPTPTPVDDPAGDFSAGTSVAPAFGTVMAIFALSMVWTGL